jgi:hypothetical protein
MRNGPKGTGDVQDNRCGNSSSRRIGILVVAFVIQYLAQS